LYNIYNYLNFFMNLQNAALATLTSVAMLPSFLGTALAAPPTLGDCQIFPTNNAWNMDVSASPVHPLSNNYISNIGLGDHVHPDFGEGTWDGAPIGIPFITVDDSQPMTNINFTAYGDESDPGPYPIPTNAPIEGGSSGDGDRHVIAVDTSNCMLYELYRAFPTASGWNADSGAVFNLNSNALRPDGWTSADAAGLPIFPGLARYDEVAAGEITHALRFTVRNTQKAYIPPATHYASDSTDPNRPPMGLRVRMKANFDTSGFTGQSRIIVEALKKYGMILADNGSDWYISGEPNEGWNNDDLNQLKDIPGSAFEAVDTSVAKPAVNFSTSKSYGEGPLDVTFTDTSYALPEATSWLWNFGDGETSTEQNPTHMYDVPGSYNVSLSVTNDLGTSTYTKNSAVNIFSSDDGVVWRFFNKKIGTWLYTANDTERDQVITMTSEWNYEGEKFKIVEPGDANTADTIPLHRFFNKCLGGHIYTISETERQSILTLPCYNYEGIKFLVYPQNSPVGTGVYRFFDTKAGVHLFTVSEAEKNSVQGITKFNFEGSPFRVLSL
jgi:hypothetical protein